MRHGGFPSPCGSPPPEDPILSCTYRPYQFVGTLIGHVAPGSLFILWGGWWAYNVCLRAAVTASNNLAFSSSAWYRFPSKNVHLIEPVLKIVFPIIALSMELFLDHLNEPTPYQSLYCPKGTKLAGEFAGENVNNWQHASSYPAVIASGFVDILSHYVELPSGVTRAFSSLWIGIMSFLMFVHEKHEALDKMVHWLLAMSMLIAFVFQVAEMGYPRSIVVSMGKAVSTVFVGAWLVEIGVVMYTGRAAWTHDTSRAVGAMMAPIFFCMIFLTICLGVLVMYVVLTAMQRRGMVPSRMVATCVDGGSRDEETVGVHRRRPGVGGGGSGGVGGVAGGKLPYERDYELGNLMTERSFDSDSAHD